MKPIQCWILIFSLFLLAGCSTQQITKKEEELKTAVKSELKTKQAIETERKLKEKEDKNEKIKDIDAVIKFVNETDINKMDDQFGKKLKILKNYEVHYFDFTGEGNDDVAIVTWEEDNSYLPVIFVTTDVWENEYYLINSDFRGSEGDEFFSEGSFIIKDDKKNQSYDIAYNIGNEFIQMSTRYVSYGDVTQVLQPEIGTKYVIDNTLEKVDGFKKLNVHSTYTYFDEKGGEHKYDDLTRAFTFNDKNYEFDVKETYNMEGDSLEKLIAENFIVGTDDSLKTFDTLYNESDLETAINYYDENRTKFNKKARIQYVEDYEAFINRILAKAHDEIPSKDEVITDGVISSVSIPMDPIPEKVSSVFNVVKEFFVPDEAYKADAILREGYYTITCIQSDMTKKIRLMQYDKEVLMGEQDNERKGFGYVDAEFQSHDQVVEEIKDLVYPTVLINNLSQIDEVKYKDIWKANIVIVPEKINFY